MDGRHELKFCVNVADAAQLRSRLRVIAKPDEYAGADGAYKVRSLYFDNYADKAVTDKLSGQSRREKFRLRYYNDDDAFIRAEKKSKRNRLSYKESAVITSAQCGELLKGRYDFLRISGDPILTELYAKIRYQNLRPKNVVDYQREAYVYRAGNVRVTFDAQIKASENVFGFLNKDLAAVPATPAIILEVKYTGFLPDIIRDILQIGSRNQTEFSKYVAARLV